MYSNEMIKKFCRVSLFALGIGLGVAVTSPAQALLPPGSPNATGPVPLNQAAKDTGDAANKDAAQAASEIPDEIALFDDGNVIPTPGTGLITPNNGEANNDAAGSGVNVPPMGETASVGEDIAPNKNNAAMGNPTAPSANINTNTNGALPTLQPGNPLIAKVAAPQTEKDILSEVDNELFNENKRLAMEKELEQKIIEEQAKLRKVELAFEKLRQERLLNAYKEHMLEEEQKWIKSNQAIYDEIANQKKEQELWTTKYKEKLKNLVSLSENVVRDAQIKMEAYKREVSDLQTQISILKARMEAQQKTNPFGQGVTEAGGIVVGGNGSAMATPVKKSINLGDLYVIMEITGQDDNINAKLMNREGQTFLVKNGTKLKSGDVVTEITTTYVKTDNNGEESYLYFASGGVMENEPESGSAAKRAMAARGALTTANVSQANPRGLVTSKGVPGVSRDMMLR